MEQTFYIQLFTFPLSSVGRVADSESVGPGFESLRGNNQHGAFVYRLGRKIFILKRGVRFPYALQIWGGSSVGRARKRKLLLSIFSLRQSGQKLLRNPGKRTVSMVQIHSSPQISEILIGSTSQLSWQSNTLLMQGSRVRIPTGSPNIGRKLAWKQPSFKELPFSMTRLHC